MRITESQLRQIIREELGRQRDEDDPEEEWQEPEPDRATQPSAFSKQFFSHFGGAEDQGTTFSISKRKRSNIRI